MLTREKSKLVKGLVYPAPEPKSTGLGIHVTPGLDGIVLLGPNARYVDRIDYSVDEQQKGAFHKSVARFLPMIAFEDLEPEMAGIRPTLQEPAGEFRDFIIQDERDKGLPRFINLVGIESPGLTSAPAIARYVERLVDQAWRNWRLALPKNTLTQAATDIPSATLRDMHLIMLKIRRFEEKITELYPAQEIKTPVHLYIGQEAIAAGVCANLTKSDYIFSTHRSHGHYIAKGGELKPLMAELYGRKTGCSKIPFKTLV